MNTTTNTETRHIWDMEFNTTPVIGGIVVAGLAVQMSSPLYWRLHGRQRVEVDAVVIQKAVDEDGEDTVTDVPVKARLFHEDPGSTKLTVTFPDLPDVVGTGSFSIRDLLGL